MDLMAEDDFSVTVRLNDQLLQRIHVVVYGRGLRNRNNLMIRSQARVSIVGICLQHNIVVILSLYMKDFTYPQKGSLLVTNCMILD